MKIFLTAFAVSLAWAIYAALAREIPVPTASALFVDDRANNVLGALNAGFDALQFTGIATLREALNHRGLAVGPGDGLSS